MIRRYHFFPVDDPYPRRLPRARRVAVALLTLLATVALLVMLLYPLRR